MYTDVTNVAANAGVGAAGVAVKTGMITPLCIVGEVGINPKAWDNLQARLAEQIIGPASRVADKKLLEISLSLEETLGVEGLEKVRSQLKALTTGEKISGPVDRMGRAPQLMIKAPKSQVRVIVDDLAGEYADSINKWVGSLSKMAAE